MRWESPCSQARRYPCSSCVRSKCVEHHHTARNVSWWRPSAIVLLSTYCSQSSHDDCAILVSNLLGLLNRFSASGNSLGVHGFTVLDSESDILHTITTASDFVCHVSHCIGVNRALKDKDGITLLYHMRGNISAASLQTTISEMLEAKSGTVVRGCLLGICYSEFEMIKAGIRVCDLSVGSSVQCWGLKSNMCALVFVYINRLWSAVLPF